MNVRTFNVGVIGLGGWGRKILEEYAKIPEVRVTGVVDPAPKQLAYAAERYGIKRAHEEPRALFADPATTAVHIAAPNAEHFKIAEAALQAGKHVLVEKPMCQTSAEAHRLVEIAERENLTLSVGHIYRFNSAIIELRRLLSEAFFGPVYMVELRWSNLERAFEDRDVVMDLAPHIVDILNFLLGTWPSAVSCSGGSFRRAVQDEAVSMWFEFARGTRAHAIASWLIPPKTRRLLIAGENRSAGVDMLTQEIAVQESGYQYRLAVERNNTIHDELIHFIKSVGDPLTETRNSGLLGAQVMDVLEALRVSKTSRKSVNVSIHGAS